MATGRANQLTKQAGEYIVAAELSRRGFISTTFTGNVPSYDIVAVDEKQIVGGPLTSPYPDLICVMVQIAPVDPGRRDRFFVLPWRELARIVTDGHAAYLAKHHGVRPRRPDSLHTAVKPTALTRWENRWDVIKKRVKPASKP